MSSSVRSAIDEILEQAVETRAVPNVVAIAADREGIIYEGAAGPRVPGESGKVSADRRFRIMSMTKMVATVAALQLMEQSKLDLDAPVEEYCAQFAQVQVRERIDGGKPVLRPAAGKATVKQLITHTSGLGYWFWSSDVLAWEQATGTPNVLSDSNAVFTAPMVADPGTRFVYGINTDWLGKVVEAAGHGLYSTQHDYLKFQRMLLGNGTSPDGERILSADTVDAAFTNQIGNLDFPPDIPTADPASTFGLQVGSGYKWGYGLLLNTHDEPGRRRAGTGAWAGLCNTRTGSTAAPGSLARSTRTSCRSSRRRRWRCTPTSKPLCTRHSDPRHRSARVSYARRRCPCAS